MFSCAAHKESSSKQLQRFFAACSPEIARRARAALRIMRERVPGAVELVYDNYNALVIGFGPSERASEAICSIAAYPSWVRLFFLHGKGLPDPEKRLEGEGSQVRSLVLERAETLNEPAVRALLAAAVARAVRPIDPSQPRRLAIRAIVAKQRPRRPGGARRIKPARGTPRM
jgi:hypothetical protein